MRLSCRRAAIAAALCGAFGTASAQYVMVPIPLLPGFNQMIPWAINDSGTAVTSSRGEFVEARGTYYSGGATYSIEPSAGFTETIAYGISNDGRMVGSQSNSQFGSGRAFVFQSGVTTPLPSSSIAEARAVNNSGLIVGVRYPTGGLSVAVRWVNGVQESLNWTLANYGGVPIALNETGDIAGFGRPTFGVDIPVAWRNGVSSALPLLNSYTGGHARGINSVGHIVGDMEGSGLPTRAVRWDENGPSYLSPLATSLISNARDIAENGDIVGQGRNASSQDVAVIWRNGVPIELNGVTPNRDGWNLISGASINNQGQILCLGTRNGSIRSFVLNPVPEPASLLAMGAGLVFFCRRRRKAPGNRSLGT